MIRLLLTGSLVCWGMARGQAMPELRADNLAGSAVQIPAGLGGRQAILILGFTKKSSASTRTWVDPVAREYGHDQNIVYYQLPVLEDVPSLIRGMVVSSIRKSETQGEREHTVPILEKARDWKAAARFDRPDEAYVLLVDSKGQIRWRGRGSFSAEPFGQLKKCVTAAGVCAEP